MTWRKRTIVEMALEAGISIKSNWAKQELEAFAKLVREEATAEANARANASWTLMCKKMLAHEIEACAKVCETQEDDGGEWDIQQQCANAIRARGKHD